MKRTLLLLLAGVITSLQLFAQYDINIKLKNYDNDTLIIGNYYGDRTLVKDTLIGKKGKFKFEGQDTLDAGVYLMLLRPDNRYSQFLADGKDHAFDLEWDVSSEAPLKVKGSADNELFVSYTEFLNDLRPRADKINADITEAEEAGKDATELKAKLDKLDIEVKAFQQKIITENPESLTAAFIKSTLALDMPDFTGTEDEIQLQKYYFYKDHYFDNIDLGDPALIRTPFLHERVDYYMEKLTVKDPDSIKKSIDFLLSGMAPSHEATRFYTSHMVNKYANMKVVGMDAVYVHMIDKYYMNNKTPWVDQETLDKMKQNAINLRPILIGKTFPAITTYKADGTPVEINKLDADYTIVLFWSHTCGHCTKSMPDVVKFYEEFQDKGVTLVSVCTKGGEKTQGCKDAIEEKGMSNFINTFDETQKYRRRVYISTTPKIFILDRDKKIIIKDIPTKELSNVMTNVMEIDQKKSGSME